MRNLILVALIAISFSCANEAEQGAKEETNIVSQFLENPASLEKSESKTPIADFEKTAKATALKFTALNKDNIKQVLEEAKIYSHSIIIVEDHTIVEITDLENCKSSGSWGACMPYGNGYIKKGDLVKEKDYINNIIGLPDNQKRTIYFFK